MTHRGEGREEGGSRLESWPQPEGAQIPQKLKRQEEYPLELLGTAPLTTPLCQPSGFFQSYIVIILSVTLSSQACGSVLCGSHEN